jgi:exportin-1
MGGILTNELPAIIEGLCNSTLSMVQNDFTSRPEYRDGFFSLVTNIIKHGTAAFFNLPHQLFQQMVNTVLFAMQHEKPETMDLGLQGMHALLVVVRHNTQITSSFYEFFYMQILKEILKLLTDYRHQSGFKLHCHILQEVLGAVDQEGIINESTKI